MDSLNVVKEKELTPEEWKKGLKILAERVVSDEQPGRWTKEMRVALVYSVLCSLARLKGAKF